jgi:hypothetical protein
MLSEQAQEASQRIHFVPWGTTFFAYLTKEKAATNPALLELIYRLGQDGRQELALSIFNFLRPSLWQAFCRDRRRAKQQANRLLRKVAVDLRRAAKACRLSSASAPEVRLNRMLAEGSRSHLSDILEAEAEFLAIQARLARIACARQRDIFGQPDHSAMQREREGCKRLSQASRQLVRAAKSYRELLTLHPTTPIGRSFQDINPIHLPKLLDEATTEVHDILNRVPLAFNKKRVGITHDLSILVRLQEFVQEFGRRLDARLPPTVARKLNASDLADLVEAGKMALGAEEDSTLTNPESIGRALLRFKTRKSNVRTCLILRDSASQACDNLRF